jgi:hypothetical protein
MGVDTLVWPVNKVCQRRLRLAAGRHALTPSACPLGCLVAHVDRLYARGEVQSSGCWLTSQGGIDLIEVGATMHGPPKYATLLTRLDRRQQIRGQML